MDNELKIFADNFCSENGIREYKLEFEDWSTKGEGYLGDLCFFSIVPKSGASLHFVRKRENDSNKETAIKKACDREIYIYKVIFPEFQKFLQRYNREDQLDFIPEIYSVKEDDTQAYMIMKNMKYSGYTLIDRRLPMHHLEVSLVIETVAKFHGMSFAMKQLDPERFKKLTGDMEEIWPYFKNIFSAENYFKPIMRDVLKKMEEDGRHDLVSKYRPIENDIENIVYVNVEEKDKLVICHGDIWVNNMLFKIDKQGNPESVCLIDFQIASLNSPVIDLCFFLFVSGDKNVLENIDDYLKLYHEKLSDFLRGFEVDIEPLFSFEKLMDHWRKYCKYGLVLATYAIQIALAEADEVPDDINQLTFEDSAAMKNAKMFNERMDDLLTTFAAKYM